MYEKCLKKEIDKQKLDAITLAQALAYVSPSSDNAQASRKQRIWNNFMNSLDWNKITKKPSKPDPTALMSVFGALGVPSTKTNKGVKK